MKRKQEPIKKPDNMTFFQQIYKAKKECEEAQEIVRKQKILSVIGLIFSLIALAVNLALFFIKFAT